MSWTWGVAPGWVWEGGRELKLRWSPDLPKPQVRLVDHSDVLGLLELIPFSASVE